MQLTAPDGRTIRLGYPEVVAWTGNWLYQPILLWENPVAGAGFLAGVEMALDDPAGEAGRLMAQIMVSLRDDAQLLTAPYAGPLNATALAVNCLENDYPEGAAAHAAAVDARAAAVPHFGALRGWADSPCAHWTAGPAGYRGPWDAETAEPILIMNSRFDPATPLAAAQRLHELLPNSVLLVHEGAGHVTVQQSGCTTDAASAYLVDGLLPAPGTTCDPDRVPFA